MNIKDQRDTTINSLDNAVIDTTASEVVETIKLEVTTNDYIHGFKIAYDDITFKPLMGRYFRASLIPVREGVDGREYKEIVLDPEQFNAVLAFRGLQATKNAYIREINITFKKDPNRGKMTDL